MSRFIWYVTLGLAAVTPWFALSAPPRLGTEQVIDPQPGLSSAAALNAPLMPHPTPPKVLQLLQPVDHPGQTDSCRTAALALMSLLSNQPGQLADYAQAAAAASTPSWGPTIRTYKANCFSSVDGLPNALRDAQFPRWAGVLRFNGNLPQCSGFLVAPDTLRTARHCFFEDDGSPRPWATHLDTVKLYPFGQPNTPISIKSIKLPSSVQNAGGDVIVGAANDEIALTLTKSIPGTLPPVRAPRLGDTLATAGPFTVDGSGTPVISLGTGCVITRLIGDCIVHRCQTTDGFSGAPLVAIENGSVSIVGMHLGPDTYVGCTDSAGTANAGWIVPMGAVW
jgi:hypothetical protein